MPLLKRSLAVVAVTAAALAVASAAYQTWGSARDRRRYPPPGRMVDVGGRRIHLWIAGEGTPAVVLVPALGDACLDVAPLLPELAVEATTVVFDRAGLGWSDPRSSPMGFMSSADDLHTALHRAGIDPPYVLAGHSMGGWVLLLFAAAFPEEVAGLVFIDSSHPDQHRRLPGYGWRTLKHSTKRRFRWYGIRRLRAETGGAASSTAPQHAAALAALELGDRQRRTAWWELALRHRIGAAVRDRTQSLGSTPITVLTCSEENPDAATADEARQHFETWYPLQADLAALSTDSKHIVAERAGHYIHHDQPELVVSAIVDVVRRARA